MGADSPVLMLLASVGIFPLAYEFGSRIVLLLAIGNVIAWVVANRYPDSPKSQTAMLLVAVLGVTLYAVGRLHRLRREIDRFADVYLFSGLLVLLAIVFVNTFTQNWDEMIEAGVEPFAAPSSFRSPSTSEIWFTGG